MLTDGTRVHLQRFCHCLSEAFDAAGAAIASMGETDLVSPTRSCRKRPPKLRQVPLPDGPVSELDQQRAKAILTRKGLSVTEMGR